MFCKNCGQQLSQEGAFCAGCGTPISRVVPPTPAGSPESTEGGAASAPAPAQVSLTKSIGEEVKERSKDAWKGIKLFAVSPVGGLPQSFEMFEPSRAMSIGIVFAILYEAMLFVGIYRMADRATSIFGGVGLPVGEISGKQMFQLIVAGLIPFVTLAISGSVARTIFRGKGTFAGDVYTAGASLLPFGAFALVASFLGPANVEVIAALSVFALTYNVLMLYAGCSRISGIPEAGAAPAVPVMLLLTAWLTKIIVSAILF